MDINIQKLKKCEIEIIKKVHKICIENNLKYYMVCGTLLGAVRHKGIIPWDDDIDIGMYREDYNKLISIIKKEYSDIFFIQTPYTDKYYIRYIAKIRLKGTELVEEKLARNNSERGVYIDIFPLDHIRKTGGFELALRGKIVRMYFAYKSIRYDAFAGNNKKELLGKILKPLICLISDNLINKILEWACQKDNNKKCLYTTNFASHYKWKKQLFENTAYGEGILLPFEDTELYAPTDYKKILTQIFGKNYMELPPEEKRVHHKITKLDLGKYEKEYKL